MDQLAPAIQWIKKNIFWLGCGLISVLMIAIWFVISMGIDQKTADKEKEIKNSIQTTKNIQNKTPSGAEDVKAHPNSKSEAGVKEEMRKTIDSIIAAWEKRVADQEKILTWPSVIPSPQFASTFSRYNPPELIPDTWLKGDGRLGSLLELYALKIPEQMVYLCGDEVLRTRWKYDPEHMEAVAAAPEGDEEEGDGGFGGFGGGGERGGMGGGLGGPAGDDEEAIDMNQFAVVWEETNQDLWYSKLTQFKGRDDHQHSTNTPTPLQCYMLQQDLWLLEAMFRIIREVNGDSEANDLSVIKRLDHVVFGREAGGKLGALTPYDPRLGKGVGGGGEGLLGAAGSDDEDGEDSYDESGEDMADMFGGGRDGGFGAGAPGAGSFVGFPPYHKRYVDLNFEQLDAKTVKDIITAETLPAEGLEMIVSKRVPVRIALRMKETEISTFMAACANSPFAFEIQQVRWNKHTPGEEITIGGADSEDDGRAGGFDMDVGGFGPGGGTALLAQPVEVRTSYDVNVEFYGIVKIYNPVRAKFLRQAAGLEDDSVESGETVKSTSTDNGNSKP